jgi:hypothetical protein
MVSVLAVLGLPRVFACLRLCNVHVITGRNDPSLLILCEERYVYELQARNK